MSADSWKEANRYEGMYKELEKQEGQICLFFKRNPTTTTRLGRGNEYKYLSFFLLAGTAYETLGQKQAVI